MDVFEAIRDTFNVVLTTTERSNNQARVRDIERRPHDIAQQSETTSSKSLSWHDAVAKWSLGQG